MPILPTFDSKHTVVCAALLAGTLCPLLARAALGEPEERVSIDAQQLEGSVKSTERSAYRINEIQLPSGTTLREFSQRGGTVFAVAWSGPAIPNLRQALGQYFDTYADAAKSAHGGHTHLRIEQGDLIVQSNGHMRAFTGRAYLATALPAGINLDDIR